MNIDERLERLLSAAELHERQIEANSRQIEANSRQIEANGRQIEANGRQIEANGQQLAELRNMVASHDQHIAELREANALLVRMMSQQQDELREYKKTTNAALDRIDRTLMLLFEQRNNGHGN